MPRLTFRLATDDNLQPSQPPDGIQAIEFNLEKGHDTLLRPDTDDNIEAEAKAFVTNLPSNQTLHLLALIPQNPTYYFVKDCDHNVDIVEERNFYHLLSFAPDQLFGGVNFNDGSSATALKALHFVRDMAVKHRHRLRLYPQNRGKEIN